MAWISPVLIVKLTPFKISLSSIDTCKSLISNVDGITIPSKNVRFHIPVYNNFNVTSKVFHMFLNANYNENDGNYKTLRVEK
ncbi:hypothetical protein GCM10008139_02820 [Staphylococcus chromogenes]|nr:hypothetical protein GCM10008139_02820 [Staphylococcus chromogenes]